MPKTQQIEKRRLASLEVKRAIALKKALKSQRQCEDMTMMLNESKAVQRARKRFAVVALLKQAVFFVAVLVGLVFTTTTSPGHGVGYVRYKASIIEGLEDSWEVRLWR